MKFNFEKNLEHQSKAVESVINVFDCVEINKPEGINKEFQNPVFDTRISYKYSQNIGRIQEENSLERKVKGKSHILDIMMETGTGKTYTYTKTIFELNNLYGIFKFIIVVPTLAIKAGTIDFLKSESSRQHFKEQYGKTIKLHIVESKKGKKTKKRYMPAAINSFVNSGNFEKNKIQVLIINRGMINASSKDKTTGKQVLTLGKSYDTSLFDKYSIPFDAISATKPFMIIDEPHKFSSTNKTWNNIQKMKPQFIIRYGATFPDKTIKVKDHLSNRLKKEKVKDYINLIYTLNAVDSFNRNLVKGVIGHITEFDEGKNTLVKFVNSDGKEASFHLLEKQGKKRIKLTKNESLEKVHPAMTDLIITKLNKTKLELSNGLELKKGDKINPYSYATTLQETMIRKAIKNHFEQEKKYLTRNVKIKPLTLFFIDNIEEYRNKNGFIRNSVEKYIQEEIKKLLKNEKDKFYKNYLEETIKNISKTHAGYFARDKKETDEVIEKEINEILHNKQAILNLENPRRFIFSKWTLREGWDNPNIFQICKLRSSGSEISKLQEVGRGLRLPVNQYGNRVKDEQFFLNYFVDFTENDFVEKLVNEINEKSGSVSSEIIPTKLDSKMIKLILEKYSFKDENDLLDHLDSNNVIKRNNDFKENGFDYIKHKFPIIFTGIDSNKIRKAKDKKKKIKIRSEKYSELKILWEKLNEKVILEYKIKNEIEFKKILNDFLQNISFTIEGTTEKISKMKITNNQATIEEEIAIYDNEIMQISTIKYSDFLKQLSTNLNINLKTLHEGLIESKININKYLNQSTLRIFKQKFNNYLLSIALNKFGIEYQKVTNTIHPTKFTDSRGKVLKDINASDIGVFHSEEKVAQNYLLDELFYDSDLEKKNIKTQINEVTIFTKIPKNSIKIPVSGGKSYSPDFAYVIDFINSEKKLYFIVETKNTEKENLRNQEIQKIKHAEKFFGDTIKIKFKKQFSSQKITQLIHEISNQK